MENLLSQASCRFPFGEYFTLDNEQFHFQDIVHILPKFLTEERLQKIDEVIEGRTFNFVPVMDSIHDEGNIHAAIRSAESFGFASFHNIRAKKIKKGRPISMGCHKWLNITHWPDRQSCLQFLRQNGYKIGVTVPPLSTHLPIPTFELEEIPAVGPLALVFGNEAKGVDPQILQEADFQCHISTSGFSQSLNISVAAAICFFWIHGQRVKHYGKSGDLSTVQKEILKAHAYLRSVKNVKKILNHSLFPSQSHSQPQWQI